MAPSRHERPAGHPAPVPVEARPEHRQYLLSGGFVRRFLADLGAGLVEDFFFLAVKPGVAMLPQAKEDVQFMVANDALSTLGVEKTADQADDRRAVWSTVGQVTDEDEPPPLSVDAILGVAQVVQEGE